MTGLAMTLVFCLLFTGCLFGGSEEGSQSAQGSEASTEGTAQEQSPQTGSAAETQAGPVTKEMVEADLAEAIAALTGQEAENAHLLGPDDEPIEGFSYQGGTAVIARYVRIETGEVTGEGEEARVDLSITSPDL